MYYPINRFVLFLLAFSLWIPMISLINIGNGTSIQVVTFVSLFYLVISLAYIRVKLNFLFLMMFFLLYLFMHFSIKMFYFGWDEFYFSGFLFFFISLFMVVVGYTIAGNYSFLMYFLKGYYYSGILMAFFSLFQYISWSWFGVDNFIAIGLRNSISFSDALAEDRSYVDLGRAVGFFPEASILFIHLFAVYVLADSYNANFLTRVVIFLGMISTSSMGIVFILIPYLMYKFFIRSNFFINISVFIVFMAFVLFYFFYNVAPAVVEGSGNVIYSASVLDRVSNISESSSVLSRFNSFLSAFELFVNNPFFGYGVQSTYVKNYLLSNSLFFEENLGINSILISMLVWFGFFSLIFLYPILWVILRLFQFSGTRRIVANFSIAIIVPSFISLSYFNIYSFWLVLGFVLFYFLSDGQANVDS